MILAAGIDTTLAHRHEVAKAFRRGCVDVLHLDLISKRPTAACTTAFLPSKIRADKLLQLLSEKYHIGVLSNVSPDGRETLCIGHSGWIFREDIYRVIEALALGIAEQEEDVA
jgi:aspartate aminotransferase-like enzyme